MMSSGRFFKAHPPPAKSGGCPRRTDTRVVLNVIWYILDNGIKWGALPHDFPNQSPCMFRAGAVSIIACGV